jgi:hypothetical protein
MPIFVGAGRAARRLIDALMTCLAPLSDRAMPIAPAMDIQNMAMPVVSLARIIRNSVAVQAARILKYRDNTLERGHRVRMCGVLRRGPSIGWAESRRSGKQQYPSFTTGHNADPLVPRTRNIAVPVGLLYGLRYRYK